MSLFPKRMLILGSVLVGIVLGEADRLLAQENNPIQLQVTARSAAANETSVYELSFFAPDTLESDAEFLLRFPQEFGLENLKIAGSFQIKGGFTIERDSAEVVVRRFGIGPPIMPGRKVQLKLGVIDNPGDLNLTHRIEMQIRKTAEGELSNKHTARVDFVTVERKEG